MPSSTQRACHSYTYNRKTNHEYASEEDTHEYASEEDTHEYASEEDTAWVQTWDQWKNGNFWLCVCEFV